MPVQCEYLSLRGLLQLERTLEMIRENLNPKVKIKGILPTLFDARTRHGNESIEVLRENFGPLVFDTVVRKTIRVRRGAGHRSLGAEVRSQGAGSRGVPCTRAGGAEWSIVLA